MKVWARVSQAEETLKALACKRNRKEVREAREGGQR